MAIENLNDAEVARAFKKMSDDELHASAVELAERERKITLALLRHLNEIERRHLYSKFRVSSLHAYCMKELKMDDGTAGRRVSAVRLLRDLPVVEEKILSGAVTLTAVAQAGIFFRKEAKCGNAFSLNEKRDLLLELENKTTREVDKILISNSDQPEIHFKEKITPKTETKTEVKLYLDEEAMMALIRLQEIWSHASPHANLADIIKRAAIEAVEKHDPLKKAARSDKKKEKTSKAAPKSDAALPETPTSAQKCARSNSEIKHSVWMRDGAQCTFVDTRTGERCSSRHFIELDHIVPKAMGGEDSVENLRLRCRAHNQRHAINCYGHGKMRRHIDSLQ